MWVLLIHRPEAMGDMENPENPFDGIEVYGIYNSEKEVLALSDRLYADHPQWSFHMETIRLAEMPDAVVTRVVENITARPSGHE